MTANFRHEPSMHTMRRSQKCLSILIETIAHEPIKDLRHLSVKYPILTETLAHEPISDTKYLSRANCPMILSHQINSIARKYYRIVLLAMDKTFHKGRMITCRT